MLAWVFTVSPSWQIQNLFAARTPSERAKYEGIKGLKVIGTAKLLLRSHLALAKTAFAHHLTGVKEEQLNHFIVAVRFEQPKKKLTRELADAMIDHARLIIDCTL